MYKSKHYLSESKNRFAYMNRLAERLYKLMDKTASVSNITVKSWSRLDREIKNPNDFKLTIISKDKSYYAEIRVFQYNQFEFILNGNIFILKGLNNLLDMVKNFWEGKLTLIVE